MIGDNSTTGPGSFGPEAKKNVTVACTASPTAIVLKRLKFLTSNLAESTFASTAILFASDYIGGSVPRHLNPEIFRESRNLPAVMASLAVFSIAKQNAFPLADKL